MNPVRWLLVGAAVVVALALQVSFFPHLAVAGVVPDLVLLVVVAFALARGSREAMLLGFVAGLLLDLAPPADHSVGRWALSLVLVAAVAGRVRTDERVSLPVVLGTVAAASFVGTSTFALSGLLVGEIALEVPRLLAVVGIALVWDLLVGLVTVRPLARALARDTAPARVAPR